VTTSKRLISSLNVIFYNKGFDIVHVHLHLENDYKLPIQKAESLKVEFAIMSSGDIL